MRHHKRYSSLVPLILAFVFMASVVILAFCFRDDLRRIYLAEQGQIQGDCSLANITITSPLPGAKVTFPLEIGMVVENRVNPQCRWGVFEAQAGVARITDKDGNEIGFGILMATDDWMTDAPVEYTGKIEATKIPAKGPLTMIITEDDPSGERTPHTVTVPLQY